MNDDKTMLDARIVDYRTALFAARCAAAMLMQHEYGELLRDISNAEEVGPFLDPTLWRDKRQALAEDRKIFEAAHAFVEAVSSK